MRYEEILPLARETLAVHVAFLKLGYKGKDIFVRIYKNAVIVSLQRDEKKVDVPIWLEEMHPEEQESFQKHWEAVCNAFSCQEIPEEDGEKLFFESKIAGNKVELLINLSEQGLWPVS